MQTVKTAAIVVLLLTVMYGGYVSLTTPPEPVPPEIANLIEIEDEFDLGEGLPESMALTEIDPGGAVPAAEPAPQLAPASEGPNTFGANFADLTPSPAGDAIAAPPALSALDQLQPMPNSTPNKLPAIGDATASVQAAPGQAYPSTGNTIDLPDPSSVEFQPETGTPFESDSLTHLKSLNPPEPNVAMAKSDSTPSSVYAPADNKITQAAAIEPKPNLGLANAIQTADRQYGKDRLKEALATLSVFYDVPDIGPDQRQQLLSRLDPLAREVIYSKRHLLEQPYRVARGEKLVDIAAKYDVPWQLLANINGLKDPTTILPGTELKVVRGPFNAQIDLEQKELTLFLNDLYAGRFPIGVGTDPAPKTGTFMVQDKQNDRTYYGSGGATVAPDDPKNPYGGFWIDLGDQLCIHGSPFPTRPTDEGCISLPGDFADDLYGILSQGSSVSIRR